MGPPPPIAPGEHQKQDPTTAFQDPPQQGRDPSRRARISIRPATAHPPWVRDLFQKLPSPLASKPQGPLLPEDRQQPSMCNHRKSSPPSDQHLQPGEATARRAGEVKILYKEGQPEKEEEFREFDPSPSSSVPVLSASSTAAVRPPHSTATSSSALVSEEWRSRELRREEELRSAAVLMIEGAEEAGGCKDCRPRSVKVSFDLVIGILELFCSLVIQLWMESL